jgi:uncharacterized protein (DUF58 family)
VVFLLSDFLDDGFEQALKRTGRLHDVVAVRITDPREQALPAVGLVELADAETGRVMCLDTNSRAVREAFAAAATSRRIQLQRIARAARADVVEVSTDGKHLDALLRYFQARAGRRSEV